MRKIALGLVFMFISILSIQGQTISTNAEIYNYDIGDVFHYLEDMVGEGSSTNILINIVIMEKYYSLNNDTLFYVRNTATETSNSWEPVSSRLYFTDTVLYTQLAFAVNSGNIDSVYTDATQYNGHIINKDTNFYFNLYAESLGKVRDIIFYNPVTLAKHSINLVYFKKGSEIWGNPIPLSTKSEINTAFQTKVYPNPTYSVINLEREFKEGSEIIIYNALGQKVKVMNVSNNVNLISLNINSFEKGIYFYSILNEYKMLESGKFIKN